MLGYMKDGRGVGKPLISVKTSSSNTRLQQALGRNSTTLQEALPRLQISSLQPFFQLQPCIQVHNLEFIRHRAAVRAVIIGLLMT